MLKPPFPKASTLLMLAFLSSLISDCVYMLRYNCHVMSGCLWTVLDLLYYLMCVWFNVPKKKKKMCVFFVF